MTNNFTNNLKILRKKNKLTQDELGELLSVSGKTVSSWEKGRSEPKIDILIRLSDYFNVTIDELINE